MIRQFLSNKNESTTVSKSKNFSNLNKALEEEGAGTSGSGI